MLTFINLHATVPVSVRILVPELTFLSKTLESFEQICSDQKLKTIVFHYCSFHCCSKRRVKLESQTYETLRGIVVSVSESIRLLIFLNFFKPELLHILFRYATGSCSSVNKTPSVVSFVF